MCVDLLFGVFAAVVLLTTILNSLQFYPRAKSLEAMLRTQAFWIMVLAKTLVNLAAVYLLQFALFPDLAFGSVLIVAMLASVSIIENFAVRFADEQVVDVSGMVDSLSRRVMRDISGKNKQIKRERTYRAASRLADKYRDNIAGLEEEYKLMLLEIDLKEDEIEKWIETQKERCDRLEIQYARMMAQDISEYDLTGAKRLINPNGWLPMRIRQLINRA